ERLAVLTDATYANLTALDAAVADVPAHHTTALQCAIYYRDHVLTAMQTLRTTVDEMETLTAAEYWPFPTYGDLMFRT
ncbi:MAG: glutamine synthetase type III, partial [Clostridia bacterium]|nr:glutamine synthetase type III [Clostridia bacterium]